MLRPSAAPRWKTATSTLRRASAATAARARKRGGAATAASAQAPPLRSARRVSRGFVIAAGTPASRSPAPPASRRPCRPAHGRRTFVAGSRGWSAARSEEHTSELQSQSNLVCRLLLEKKKSRVVTTSVSVINPSPLVFHMESPFRYPRFQRSGPCFDTDRALYGHRDFV